MRVVYTEQALSSIDEVLNFLIHVQKVPLEKAEQILGKVVDSIDALSAFPFSGQKEELLDDIIHGHRRIVIGHYKVIYFIKNETIYITDIFDSRQSPDKMRP